MSYIFSNKDGSCTKYALACGYVQRIGNVQLYREHECYHIVRTDFDGYCVERSATFSLTEARKMFRIARAKDRADHTYILPRGSSSCHVCGNQLDGKKHCSLCNAYHIYT
jgi:hypothetical protein